MATYYVDNSVGGPGAGTIGNPWDDLSTHINAVGAAGDIFYIRGDALAPRVYDEGEIDITVNGTAVNRITVIVFPGEQVVWQSAAGDRTFDISGDYITIDGFEIDKENENRSAVRLDGTGDTVQNCTIYDCSYDHMIDVGGNDATIDNCILHDNFDGNAKDAHGIAATAGVTGMTVTDCTIYDCTGDCIQIGNVVGCDTFTIDDNELYTTLGKCSENALDIKDGGAGQSYIRRNTIYGFRACDSSCGGSGGNGEGINIHNTAINILVEGNVIYDCTRGIRIGSGACTGITVQRNIIYDMFTADPNELSQTAIFVQNANTDIYIYNNTIDNAQDEVYRFDGCTLDLYNNLCFDTEIVDVRNGAVITADYNGWFDATQTIAGGNDVGNADPKFVDQPNHDYHLLVTSTCINAGTDVGLPFNGAAPDIGRYEFGGGEETTTSTSTTTTSTSTTSTSTSTTSTSTSTTSTSTTTTTSTSSSTSTTSTSLSTSTTSTSITGTSTTSTSITSTSTSTTSTSTTTTSTSTTSTSSSTSTTLPPLLPTCPGTEKDQILVPISGGYKAYSLLVLLGIDRRKLLSTANFGNAPMHFITQRGPFQDGETAIDMRWDPRVMQLVVADVLHNRWDFWERRHSILDKLSPYRGFDPADDAPRLHIYRKWLPDGGFLQGSDAVTTANSVYVTSSTARFIEYGLEAGQRFDITTGDDLARYIVASVPNDYTVELTTHMLNTATGVGWIYRRGWGKRDLYCSLEQGPTFDEGPGASPEYPTGYHQVLRFIAHDPFWYGQEQQETYAVPTIIDALIFGGGGAWFDAAGQWLFADGYMEESNTIVYWGNVPAKPIIEITGPANRPLIVNETSDVQLQINASISEGTTVTIDTLELTAEDGDGTSWMQYLEGDLVSFSIEPPPQAPNRENAITVRFGNAKYDVSAVVIKWKNRYSGI